LFISSVDTYWLHSSRAISGLFGLSINLQDNPNTVTPVHAIQTHSNNKKHLRYASIPNEIVCTENLTPWIKLLPCGKTKGIARLFKNSNKIFESRYLSTGLHFKKVCTNPLAKKCVHSNIFELKQSLSLVFNSELILNQKEKTMWSLQALFGQKLDALCPVADVSNVYMDLGVDGVTFLQLK
jgi:GPI-anchor transamidase subunit T